MPEKLWLCEYELVSLAFGGHNAVVCVQTEMSRLIPAS